MSYKRDLQKKLFQLAGMAASLQRYAQNFHKPNTRALLAIFSRARLLCIASIMQLSMLHSNLAVCCQCTGNFGDFRS